MSLSSKPFKNYQTLPAVGLKEWVVCSPTKNNLLKNKYQDIESKNKIDKIIDYVILFEDKSNYFITNYLSN